jgi:hypothetical protein
MDSAVRQAFGVTLAGFEERFQRRTRRTYGTLAMVADLSLVFLVLSMLIFPLFVARRVRDRRKLQALLAADAAAERADRESVLAMLLSLGIDPSGADGGGAAPTKSASDGDSTDERGSP